MACELCSDGRTDLGPCGYCGATLIVGGVTSAQPREQSKAEMLADFDAKMSEAVAKVPKVNPRGQSAAGTSPETPRSAELHTGTGQDGGPPPTAGRASVATQGADGHQHPEEQRPSAHGSTAPRPKGRRPRKSVKRTSAQVTRAAEQAKREQRYREVMAAMGTFVEGQIEDEEQFVASLRDAE